MKIVLIAFAALCLGACSAGKSTEAAEQGVTTFHQALNSGDLEKIYSTSGAELKAVSTHDDFTGLLAAIHRKLGNFRSGKTIGWNVNYNTGGNFVTLNREAQFERAPAQEQFVFKISGEKPVLVGYHIKSNALIVN